MSYVFATPARTTYQARIVKPDGYPLEAASVNFRFSILDSPGTCVLYTENYSGVNMTATGGVISFSLGSGVKTYPVSSTTFAQVFSNITPNMACDANGVPTVYTPTVSDGRKIVMQFNDGGGWQTLPAMTINAVPYAMYADNATTFNGMAPSEFVQVSTIPTCAASSALRYTGASFVCEPIVAGGSVTSASVISALGYTPADGASVTTVTTNLNSVTSSVFSVSSTVSSLSNSVSSLQTSVAASFAAITSSQWLSSGTTISYSTGNVGINVTSPLAKLHIADNIATTVLLDGHFTGTAAPGYVLRKSRGTAASPTAVMADDYLGTIGARGYGTTGFSSSTKAMIGFKAAENWTDVDHGTNIVFETTAVSTSTRAEKMRISERGYVGIGTTTPVTTLDVSGAIRISYQDTCSASYAGTIRYNIGNVEFCNGSTWAAFGVSGAGLQSLNGSTSGTQNFAIGTGGIAPGFVTANGVHTLNIPLASTAAVTAGLLSNADYVSFQNKASSASVTNLVSDLNSVSSTLNSVSTNVSAVSSTVASLSSATAASFTALTSSVSAITSSQWTTVASGIHYSSGFVAVGSSATSYNFFVRNSSNTNNPVGIQNVSTSGYAGIDLMNASGTNVAGLAYSNPGTAYLPGSMWIGPRTTSESLHFIAGNVAPTARMTLTASGFVGIGTSAPISLLHLSQSTAQLRVETSSTSTSGNAPVYLINQDTTANNVLDIFFATRDNSLEPDNGAIIRSVFTNRSASGVTADLAFLTANDAENPLERMRLNSSGYLGVGTSNPSAALEISNSAAKKLILRDDQDGVSQSSIISFEGATDGAHGWVGFASTADDDLSILAQGANGDVVVGAGNSFSKGLRIKGNTGNIGFGLSAPTAKLHLAAGTSSTAPVKLTSGTLLTSPASGAIEYDGSYYYITDGTNTRRAIATVATPGTFDNAATISNSGNINLVPTGSVIVSATTASTNSQTGALVVKGGVGVAGNMNVSGTVTTNSFFMADNTVLAPPTFNTRSAGTRFVLYPLIGASTVDHAMGVDTLTFWQSVPDSTRQFMWYAGTTPIVTMKGTGNVGIGNSNPQTTLEIGTNTVSSSSFRFNSNTAYQSSMRFVADNTANWIQSGLDYATDSKKDLKFSSINGVTTWMTLQASTGSLGIGTTAPLAPLDIRLGAVSKPAIAISEAASDGFFLGAHLDLNGSDNRFYIGRTAYGIDSATPTNPTELLSVKAGGQVGIGVTPDVELHVQKDHNSDTTIKVRNSASGTAGQVAINAEASGGGIQMISHSSAYSTNWGGGISKANTAALRTYSSQPVSHMMIGTGSTAPVHLMTADTPRVTLATNGYVGIGTSAPAVMLTVDSTNGTVSAPYSTGTDKLAVMSTGNAVIQVTTPNTQTGAIYFSDPESRDPGGIGYSHLSDSMVFRANGATRMTITASGNVGVGTGTPDRNFSIVESTGGATRGLTVRTHNTSNTGGVIEVAGALGTIGSPSALTVNKALGFYTFTGYDGVSFTMQSTPTGMYSQATENWSAVSHGANLKFATTPNGMANGVERMRIEQNGNVGIGTATPAGSLHINAAVSQSNAPGQGIFLGRSLGEDHQIQITEVNGIPHLDFSRGTNTDFDGRIAVYQNSAMSLGTASGAQLLNLVNSNVGIGTTTPTAKLHVLGGSINMESNSTNGILGQISISGRNSSAALPQYSQWTLYNMNEYGTTKGLVFYEYYDTDNDGTLCEGAETCSARVTFAQGGNVGIGTQTPTTKLQVAGQITPSADNAHALGDPTLRFTAVYAVNGAIQTSDARQKKNITESDLGLDFINKLRPVSYNWRSGDDKSVHYGLIAQETEKIVNESRSVKDGTPTPIVDYDQKSGRYGLRYTELISPIIKAVQELYSKIMGHDERLQSQERKIASVEAENAQLKKENEEIKARLERLEKALQNK